MQATNNPSGRDFHKCSECRRRKVKCSPVSRTWNDRQHERCQSCALRGLECGPPLHKRNDTRNIPTRLGMRAGAETGAGTRATGPASPAFSYSNPPGVFSPAVSTAVSMTRSQSFTTVDSMLSPFQNPATLFPNRSMTTALASVAEESTEVPAMSTGRTYAQITARREPCLQILHKLEELHCLETLYRWLRSRERACHFVSTVGRGPTKNSSLEFTVNHIIIRVRARFLDMLEDAVRVTSELDASKKVTSLLRLSKVCQRFLSIPGPDGSEQGELEAIKGIQHLQEAVVEELADMYRQEGNTAEALHLRDEAQPGPELMYKNDLRKVTPNEVHEFLQICWKIQGRFRAIVNELSPAAGITSTDIPPSHIALTSYRSGLALALFANGACEVSKTDFLGRSGIHIIAEQSNKEMLLAVLKQYPDALKRSECDIYNLYPISVAAYTGESEFFKTLLERGAALDVLDKHGRDLLWLACSAGNCPIADLLLKKGRPPDGHMEPPLHAAIVGGWVPIVCLLLRYGALVGTPALQLAKQRKEKEIEEILTLHERSRATIQPSLLDLVHGLPGPSRTRATDSQLYFTRGFSAGSRPSPGLQLPSVGTPSSPRSSPSRLTDLSQPYEPDTMFEPT